MKHKLKINVANDSPKEGIVACKKKKVRRGLLRKLFGANANKKRLSFQEIQLKTSPFAKSMKEVMRMPNENKHFILAPSTKEWVRCKSFIGKKAFFIANNKKCKKMQIAY